MAKRGKSGADTSDTANVRTRGRRGQKHEPDWAPAFLEAFAEFGIVTAACGVAGVSRSTAYERRKLDEAFAAAWSDVETATTERMEAEARRRAVEGWVEREELEVAHDEDGNPYEVRTLIVRKYSDTLLMFMLKARKPDMYRERVEHTGAGGGPIQHRARLDLTKLSDEQLAALEAIQPDAGADED